MVKTVSRACQAKDPATCPYHGTEDTGKHKFLATNPNTSAVMLGELAKDKNESVRWEVARNTNTSAVVLGELAKDKKESVRWGVANNSNAPVSVLTELAKDKNEVIRRRVARNPNTSAMMLVELIKDKDQQVAELAITNLRSLPKEELLTLFSDKECESLNDLPKVWVLKLLLL